jgi:hypothetical protein
VLPKTFGADLLPVGGQEEGKEPRTQEQNAGVHLRAAGLLKEGAVAAGVLYVHMMAAKTMNISEEAYVRLLSRKGENQSLLRCYPPASSCQEESLPGSGRDRQR